MTGAPAAGSTTAGTPATRMSSRSGHRPPPPFTPTDHRPTIAQRAWTAPTLRGTPR